MANLSGFNANEHEPNTGFDPIPAGKYLAAITESEMKTTKAGNGSYLALTFQIIDGDFQNRNLWHNLNLDNPNETAVQISKGQLSAICRAVGVMAPKDSSELHNIPLIISVGQRRREDTGDIQNNIKAFYAKDGSTPKKLKAAKASKGKDDKAPWLRK